MKEEYRLPYEAEEIAERLGKVDDIPTKVSQLENDAEYLTKQDIPDLETIREGAQKGATALQEHQDISHLATKQEVEDIFPMKMVTYADLVAMRDEGRLVPGQQYRIIDFVTTVDQADAKSAGHQFDVIVTADGPSVLNEKARAAISEGDTYFTEAGANLKAWQLWYSLDNDKSRFEWADAANGKGVIYRMIDEWQNDLPYDFKNVVYNIKSIINAKKAMYGNKFSCVLTYQGPTTLEGIDYYRWQVTQVSGPSDSSMYYITDETPTIDTTFYLLSGGELVNNNDILFESFVQGYAQYTFGERGEYGSDDIVDGTMSRLSHCYSNIMEVYEVTRQYIIANLPFNMFGNYCNNNTLGRDCCVNTFGNKCSSNTFGSNCHHNTLGDKCSSNTFGNNTHEIELFENSWNITLPNNWSIKINGSHCTFDSGVSYVTCINLDGELERISHIRFIGDIQRLTMRQVSEVALDNVVVLGPIYDKSADLSGRGTPSIIYQSSEGEIVHTSLMFE